MQSRPNSEPPLETARNSGDPRRPERPLFRPPALAESAFVADPFVRGSPKLRTLESFFGQAGQLES